MRVNEQDKFVFNIWKESIRVQMHFNELIIKNRTAGLSIIAGFIATGVGLYKGVNDILGISVWVLSFFLLVGFFILDYFYYFKLLLGSVRYTDKIGKGYEGISFGKTDVNPFGITKEITKAVEGVNGEPGKPRSPKFVISLYVLMFIGEILVILFSIIENPISFFVDFLT